VQLNNWVFCLHTSLGSFQRADCDAQVGQKYDPHHDFFYDQINARPEHGGQRIATVLMYLCAPFSSPIALLVQADAQRRQQCLHCSVAALRWTSCHAQCRAVWILPSYHRMKWTFGNSRKHCIQHGLSSLLSNSERVALFCRTTPDEGGETVFPQAGSPPVGPGWSDCARQVRRSRHA